MSENRVFAFIDILGFKKLVETDDYARVRHVLRNFLTSEILRMNSDCDVLCFSDTTILYANNPGLDHIILDDIRVITQKFSVEMLLKGITVRGVIAYGEFNVEKESNVELFWGKELINAYEAEKTENIIGIFMLPNAVAGLKSVQALKQCHPSWYHVKYDNRIMVNLFPKLADVPRFEDDLTPYILEDPDILKEIKAYFILEELEKQHSGSIKEKYTNALLLASKFIYHDISHYRNMPFLEAESDSVES